MSQAATEWPVAQPVLPLEQRLQQLESAVAALHDVEAMEERIVERMAQRLQTVVRTEAERVITARQPAAAPVATPVTSVAAAAPPYSGPPSPAPSPSGQSIFTSLPWLVVDVCREGLAIFRMFFDFKFKAASSTRLLTVIFLLAILTSQWWDPLAFIPVVGWFLDKLVTLVLAFVMFKALSREARRYLETRNSL
jgi:hypothetical protein